MRAQHSVRLFLLWLGLCVLGGLLLTLAIVRAQGRHDRVLMTQQETDGLVAQVSRDRQALMVAQARVAELEAEVKKLTAFNGQSTEATRIWQAGAFQRLLAHCEATR